MQIHLEAGCITARYVAACSRATLGVDRAHHALLSEVCSNLRDKVWSLNGSGVDAYFVGTGPQQLASGIHVAHASTDSERNEKLLGGTSNKIDHRVATIARRGDVEEDHLIGAFGVVASGELNRVACIAKTDEVDSFHDSTVGDVETRNHSSERGRSSARHARSAFNASRTSNRPS